LRAEIARMRGQIEVLANQIETADRRQKDLYVDIDTRLRKLEQAASSRLLRAPTSRRRPPARSKGYPRRGEGLPARSTSSSSQLPDGGFGDAGLSCDIRQLARAQCAVLDRHGFTRAARLQKRDRAQRKLLTAWPDSPKAPDAMLSIASAQETMATAAPRKGLSKTDRALSSSSAATSASSACPLTRSVERARRRATRRLVTGGAFGLAFIFGRGGEQDALLHHGRVSDWVTWATRPHAMWLLPIRRGAMLGSSALQVAGVVDLSKSHLPRPQLHLAVVLVGGFLFASHDARLGLRLEDADRIGAGA